jgi:hypothetical protein
MIALARTSGTEAVAEAMLPRLIAPNAPAAVVEKLKAIMLGVPGADGGACTGGHARPA